ncbi:tryptophan synthase subunit alpha [Streptomyces sp. TR02-1]|uniref:tryptophan synthase subunit alpha n=1 Tax=Streptomyces sp. TR02-1 TaxID=3385977 RepID=UPI0039A25FEC
MSTTPDATPLDGPLAAARAAGRPALVGYLPAGYPTVGSSLSALRALSRHVDVIELGIPRVEMFTSGLHRTAHQRALEAGATVGIALRLVRHLTAGIDVPVLVNTHWRPIARHGVATFAAALGASGAAGVVLPEVHPTGPAGSRWRLAAARHRLATAFVAGADQLAAAARASTGCVYVPGLLTPTARNIDALTLTRRRGQVQRWAPAGMPIVVGRGITNPAQAAALATPGNGIAIGSALIQAAESATDPSSAIEHIDLCARRFAHALTRPARIGGAAA